MPGLVAEEWVQIHTTESDDGDLRPYYWDRFSGEVIWDLPAGTTASWLVEPSADGRDSYRCLITNVLYSELPPLGTNRSAQAGCLSPSAADASSLPPPSAVAEGDSNSDVWAERILRMCQEERLGLQLSHVTWKWMEFWPDDPIDDYRPCKKLKDAITKYVDDTHIHNNAIFHCQRVDADDLICNNPELLQKAVARATSIATASLDEKQRIRSSFEAIAWQDWAPRYATVNSSVVANGASNDALFRCVIECGLPKEAIASRGASPLDGVWTYHNAEGGPYEFAITEVESNLTYVEEINGDKIEGILQQDAASLETNGDVGASQQESGINHEDEGDQWHHAMVNLNGSTCGRLRVRPTTDDAAIEAEVWGPDDFCWSPLVRVRRATRYRYTGYGEGPVAAATSAMKEALDDPRLPPSLRRPASEANGTASSSTKGVEKRKQEAPLNPRFGKAMEALKAALQVTTDARQLQGDELGEDELEEEPPDLMGSIRLLVDSVCDLLAGDEGAVPLTDPGWAASRVLSFAWQYAIAMRSKEDVRRLGLAIERSHEKLFKEPLSVSSDGLAVPEEPGENSSIPPGQQIEVDAADRGLDFPLWEELVERAAAVAVFDVQGASSDRLAEEALLTISPDLVPPRMRYAAHFGRLLQLERAEELKTVMSELDLRGITPIIFQGKWSTKELHRPDLDLRIVKTGSQKLPGGLWSNLRRGDLVAVRPFPADEGEGVLAELRSDFSTADKEKDKELPEEEATELTLKLKLYVITLPQGNAEAALLSGSPNTGHGLFSVVPLDLSQVTHERQLEALRNISKSDDQSAINKSIRQMVIESWRPPDIRFLTSREGSKSKNKYKLGSASYTPNVVPGNGSDCFGNNSQVQIEQLARWSALAREKPDDMQDNGDDGVEATCVPMTDAQKIAVRWSTSRRCTVIRGPPGTGKTHTACAIVDCWLRGGSSSGRVLVVTQSNAAALNIQERLAYFDLPCVRIGMQLRREELLSQPYFNVLFEPKELEPLLRPCEELSPAVLIPLFQKAAKRAPVLVMTCISSGNMGLLGNCTFCRVLIDEAAQATEPTSLVPLMTSASAVAFVGDDKQLPATLKSHEAKQRGLDQSLFERLLHQEICCETDGFVQLDVQRRMHSSIAEFPSVKFYGGSIINGCGDEDRPPILGVRWPDHGRCRVLFVDCSQESWEERSGSSTMNQGEANLLVSLLGVILSRTQARGERLYPRDIAIITGYSAQREVLKDCAKRQLPFNPHIDTVDGFQGMERELVLVSTARSREVGFLRDARRTNVLLTRARRGLIVFGDARTLASDTDVWGHWLHYCKTRGAIRSARDLFRELFPDTSASGPAYGGGSAMSGGYGMGGGYGSPMNMSGGYYGGGKPGHHGAGRDQALYW